MNMKKTLTAVLSIGLAISMLTGCGGGEKAETAAQTAAQTETAAASEVDDQAAADEVAALIDAIYVQTRTADTDAQCTAAKAGWDALTDAQKELVEGEFADPDYVVLMLSCDMDLKPLEAALMELPRKEAILQAPPILPRPKAVLSVREAVMAPCEELPVEDCLGRTLADYGVSCPPAVPIVVCGEEIGPESLACLEYYGVEKCRVVCHGN
jgi:arginine/lysine/ornithine decarboxylase